jgi:hypothetical protein
MNCRECLENFSSMSADDVPASIAQSIRQHLAACPECEQEWQVFEYTLFVLSSSTQPLPAPDASAVMWQRCSEHIFQKVEAARVDTARASADRNPNSLESGAARTGFWGWATRQPGWSWATLCGAAAILGAAWWLAPHEEPAFSPGNSNNGAAPQLVNRPNDPGTLITFRRPPDAASGLVNHHTAMAADPFTDSVGSTLVSYSATTPSTSPRR